MKKYLRFALFLGAWAAITWIYRDRLLRIARPESASVPKIRPAGTPAAPAKPKRALATAPDTDDLTEIKGIGPVYQSRLADAGITTFSELAAAEPGEVAGTIDATESMIDDWIDQARNYAR